MDVVAAADRAQPVTSAVAATIASSSVDAMPFVAATDALAALRANDETSMERESSRLWQQAIAPPSSSSSSTAITQARPNSSCFDDVLSADLLSECLQFLDLPSLAVCDEVNQRWHIALQDPTLWEHVYCAAWRRERHGVLQFQPTAHRIALLPHLRTICRQRARRAHSVQLSMRMRSWMRESGNVVVYNDAMRRNLALGCIESVRTEHALPLLACSEPLDVRVQYFEATIAGCGSVGVASVSTARERQAYGAGSESHLGWYPVSYGYHGDDGLLYWNAMHRPFGGVGGSQRALGPPWGDTTPFQAREWRVTTVGCGLVVDTQQLFFTLNGEFVGFAPVAVERSKEFAAAVSLHQLGDSAELNFGATAFAFDIEQFVWYTLRKCVVAATV